MSRAVSGTMHLRFDCVIVFQESQLYLHVTCMYNREVQIYIYIYIYVWYQV